MPSFDIVSEVDLHQLTNAVDNANRIIETRFDFKGIQASFERKEHEVTLTAEADIQLDQMLDMLRSALIKSKIDPLAMDVGDKKPSGKVITCVVKLKNGVDQDTAKKIVKLIKDTKMKVQAQIQGDAVRVTGKKRDDLQEAIAMLRTQKLELPLQFDNFRD